MRQGRAVSSGHTGVQGTGLLQVRAKLGSAGRAPCPGLQLKQPTAVPQAAAHRCDHKFCITTTREGLGVCRDGAPSADGAVGIAVGCRRLDQMAVSDPFQLKRFYDYAPHAGCFPELSTTVCLDKLAADRLGDGHRWICQLLTLG